MALESFREPALVFLRHRRSGKSLGLNYKPHFESLTIHEHVTNKRVFPGQYFVLQLDFAAVDRSQDRKEARHSLNMMLNESIM
ncbi:hypothetical protein BGZ74_001698 [Mortierella antarctica]|nr:hypothetical protein BGZ74_001698 [Mortierella antarctica]